MNKIENNFDKHRDELDKNLRQTRRMFIIVSIISIMMVLGGMSFLVWVIIKLMSHFGIM